MIKTNVVETTQTYEFNNKKRVQVEYKDGRLHQIILTNSRHGGMDFFYFKSQLELEETIENLQAILEDINDG